MINHNDLPDWVLLTSTVEIFSAGDKLKLYYRNEPDALYKFPNAIFGLSPNQIRTALKNGKAKPYK
jgi:hypothetical protein